MESGIYSVSLTSDDEPVAEAVIVLSGRIIHGGGPGYLCKGYYNPESDALSCELWAYRKDHATIFGRRDRYTLRLRRDTQHPTKLIFSGHTDEEPLMAVSFELVWQSSLAE